MQKFFHLVCRELVKSQPIQFLHVATDPNETRICYMNMAYLRILMRSPIPQKTISMIARTFAVVARPRLSRATS